MTANASFAAHGSVWEMTTNGMIRYRTLQNPGEMKRFGKLHTDNRITGESHATKT